ncbi:MAG: S8 family serine peptidase [Bacteroidota bacterium]
MKKIYILPFLTFLLFSLTIAVTAQTIHKECEDGKIWFKLNDNANVTSTPIPARLISKYKVTEIYRPFAVLNSPELQRTYQVNFEAAADVDAFIQHLQELSIIDYAEKVPYNRAAMIPNDANYATDQWYMPVIDADKAWNTSTGNSSVVVAIVDNAVEKDHVDLAANIWINSGEIANNGVDDDANGYIDDINGYDVADGDNNPSPPNTTFTHGTHVAGCAGAVSNNTIGVASVGFNISIMPVKVTKNTAANSLILSHCYEGVAYAIAAGADVISMSWGSYSYSATSEAVMNTAHAQGIVLVSAAGNDSLATPTYPAAYNHVIAVANARKNDLVAKTSNFGTYIDVASPGSQINSTLPANTYGNMSGTSMACPVVSGLCGLLLSINPNLTPDQITNCIKSTAEPMPNEPQYVSGNLGAGRINANDAVICVSTITGITAKNEENTVNAYLTGPQQLTVDFNFSKATTATVKLYNQLGQHLIEKQFGSLTNQQEQFDITSLSNGVYFLIVEGIDFRYHTKIVKN